MPQDEKLWYNGFPEPESIAGSISPDELLAVVKSMHDKDLKHDDYLLVDVRDAFEGGTINNSLNIPARMIWYNIPILVRMCKQANIRRVVFYCGQCIPSSLGGRGTRAAAWFNDECRRQSVENVSAVSLENGINAWVAGGTDYTKYMNAFVRDMW